MDCLLGVGLIDVVTDRYVEANRKVMCCDRQICGRKQESDVEREQMCVGLEMMTEKQSMVLRVRKSINALYLTHHHRNQQ